MTEARLWESAPGGKVKCSLCSFRCVISEGKRGICGVRENTGGVLNSLNYGRVVARGMDPIEKKPLFHFLPGTESYSIATVGCNFRCLHCQNSDISQMPKDLKIITGEHIKADSIVAEADALFARSIAYTYTEPTIFYEFAYDCMELAVKKGLKNIFVTNGYMTEECLGTLKGLLHAANVDVKSFNDKTYKKVCGARLEPVLKSVERMRDMGIWVEVTTLIIPTINDSEEELREIAKWVASIDPGMPWHVSAFYPAYKMMDLPPTDPKTVERAREIGLSEGLRYVYTGNIRHGSGENTVCHSCDELLIERSGYAILANNIENRACPKCKSPTNGVWE